MGRRIAFVSSRTGEAECGWLISTRRRSDSSTLSASPRAAESHPIWKPGCSRLAWAARVNARAIRHLHLDAARRGILRRLGGSGILASLRRMGTRHGGSARCACTATPSAPNTLNGPPMILPRRLRGGSRIAWPDIELPAPLPVPFEQASLATGGSLGGSNHRPTGCSVQALAHRPAWRMSRRHLPVARTCCSVVCRASARVVAEAGWMSRQPGEHLRSVHNEPRIQASSRIGSTPARIHHQHPSCCASWMAPCAEDIDGQLYSHLVRNA